VEFLKDVSFRLPPISKEEAVNMIQEIKGYPVLAGTRGTKPADIDSLAWVIEKTSIMVMELPEIKELDMNPIFVYEKGLIVVDARIVM
jgi:acetyl-CoA synthetase (ADP-forming)